MENFENPEHDLNGARWHTGKPCIEVGCTEPAGTGWSKLWCQKHNAERMHRIGENLKDILRTRIGCLLT